MSREEALDLIKKTYRNCYQINQTERISDCQMAKKVQHLKDLGINSEDYGMFKDNRNAIRKNRLTLYTREKEN